MGKRGEKKKYRPWLFFAYTVIMIGMAVLGTIYCFDLKARDQMSEKGVYLEADEGGENIPGVASGVKQGNTGEDDETAEIKDGEEQLPLADPTGKE